jgi:hypothetical protein
VGFQMLLRLVSVIQFVNHPRLSNDLVFYIGWKVCNVRDSCATCRHGLTAIPFSGRGALSDDRAGLAISRTSWFSDRP